MFFFWNIYIDVCGNAVVQYKEQNEGFLEKNSENRKNKLGSMVCVIFSFCRISAYVDAMRGKWNWKTRLSTFWQNLEMEIGKYKFPLLFCGIPECIWCASSGRVILTLLHPHQSPNIHQFQTRVTFIPASEPEMKRWKY